MSFVKNQVCSSFKEDLRFDGMGDVATCPLCLDENIRCRVGNHKSKLVQRSAADVLSELAKLSIEISKLSSSVAKLSSDFQSVTPLIQKAGDTYDLLARRELKELKGHEYI